MIPMKMLVTWKSLNSGYMYILEVIIIRKGVEQWSGIQARVVYLELS